MTQRVVSIHFGAHRTGTTYLQSAFSDNSALLAERRIQYRRLHDAPSAYKAYLAARLAFLNGDPAEFDCRFAEVEDYFTGFLHAHPDEHLLISFEGILGRLGVAKTGGLYPAHAFFLQRFMKIFQGERTHGAFALREYGAFVESTYKQRLHMGHKLTFKRYVEGVDWPAFSWLPVVRALSSHFGQELSLWTFEDFARSERALVDWLFARAFRLTDATFLRLPAAPINPSLSRAALPALVASNWLLSGRRLRPRVNNALMRLLPSSKFGHPDLLDDETATKLKARYLADLETIRSEVAELYDPRVTGPGHPVSEPA